MVFYMINCSSIHRSQLLNQEVQSAAKPRSTGPRPGTLLVPFQLQPRTPFCSEAKRFPWHHTVPSVLPSASIQFYAEARVTWLKRLKQGWHSSAVKLYARCQSKQREAAPELKTVHTLLSGKAAELHRRLRVLNPFQNNNVSSRSSPQHTRYCLWPGEESPLGQASLNV